MITSLNSCPNCLSTDLHVHGTMAARMGINKTFGAQCNICGHDFLITAGLDGDSGEASGGPLDRFDDKRYSWSAAFGRWVYMGQDED